MEIEEVRYANEDLFEAAVVGVLHEIHGEVPIAYVVRAAAARSTRTSFGRTV